MQLSDAKRLKELQSRRHEPEALRDRSGEVAAAKRRYGYRCVHVLLRREAWEYNKRTYRFFREPSLQMRKRSRKRIVQGERRTPLIDLAHEL